jgi:hypothetical protein
MTRKQIIEILKTYNTIGQVTDAILALESEQSESKTPSNAQEYIINTWGKEWLDRYNSGIK